MAKRPIPPGRNPLTQVEVLAVVCVLGILAALLISGGALRERAAAARNAACRGRLAEFAQAIFLYADDQGSFLPPLHDAAGLGMLERPPGRLRPPAGPGLRNRDYLYYGGLLQVECRAKMGLVRDWRHRHAGGGNVLFGDGHAEFSPPADGAPWFRHDRFFQMDHRDPESALRRLGRELPWNLNWTAEEKEEGKR